MDKQVFFTLVIPTYNRAHLLSATLASALAQTCAEYEIIIVDDGSTDNTEEVVQSFADGKIRYLKQENRERGAARNSGAINANGKYVCFLDSDDLLYPFHLEEAAKYIKHYSLPEVMVCNHEMRSKKRLIVKAGFNSNLRYLNNALATSGNLISTNGIFIRKDIILQHPFSENMDLSGSEDYELWLRLAARYPIYCCPRVTSTIVQQPERSVLNMDVPKLITRQLTLLDLVLNNPTIVAAFPNIAPQLQYEAYSYIALHTTLAKKEKITAIKYLLKAIAASPKNLFKCRTAATLKRMLFYV